MAKVISVQSAKVGDTYKIGNELLEVTDIRHEFEPDGVDRGYNDYILTFKNGSEKRMKADDKLTVFHPFENVRFLRGGKRKSCCKRKSRCKRSNKSRKYRRKSIRFR